MATSQQQQQTNLRTKAPQKFDGSVTEKTLKGAYEGAMKSGTLGRGFGGMTKPAGKTIKGAVRSATKGVKAPLIKSNFNRGMKTTTPSLSKVQRSVRKTMGY